MLDMPYCNPPPSGEVDLLRLESCVLPVCVSFSVIGDPSRLPILSVLIVVLRLLY